MIRGIIFDCFGVLVHGSLGHLRSLVPPEHMAELNDLSHNSDYGYVSQADYLQGVGKLLGCSSDEIAAIISAQYIPSKKMIALARSLRPEYKVALLSNVGRGVIDRLFSPAELEELFDVVVLSSEVGMVKPHADIYALTTHRLGLAAEECLMIDDLPDNIVGAQAAGMQGLICSEPGQCEADLRKLLAENYARVA